MSNMTSNHSTSLGIPQPHFTSCITAHHHIPHAPHHHSTSHDHISHLVWHCTTSHLASHHIAHILHRTLFHTTATLGWIEPYPTSGIAEHSTPHQIPHHTNPHHATWYDLVVSKYVEWCENDLVVSKYVECVLCWKCGLMWYFWAVVHAISHILYHTSTSIPLCNTIFQIAPYRPHCTLHCTLLHITATLGWIRHNIPHLALQNIPHHTKFHTALFHIWCYWNTWNVWCGMMWDVVWCAVPEMWFDVKYWAVVVRCSEILSCGGEM